MISPDGTQSSVESYLDEGELSQVVKDKTTGTYVLQKGKFGELQADGPKFVLRLTDPSKSDPAGQALGGSEDKSKLFPIELNVPVTSNS